MATRISIDRLALVTAQKAQRQSNALSSRLNALRDGMDGLKNTIAAPTISTKRHTIASSTDATYLSTLLSAAFGGAWNDLIGSGGTSFYESVVQSASAIYRNASDSGRIR